MEVLGRSDMISAETNAVSSKRTQVSVSFMWFLRASDVALNFQGGIAPLPLGQRVRLLQLDAVSRSSREERRKRLFPVGNPDSGIAQVLF
jgi:hypothetical protein